MKLVRQYGAIPVFSPFAEIERELERIWGRSANPGQNGEAVAAPAADIREDAVQVVVTVELPGVRREDVQVSLNDDVLSITGERRQESETTEGRYHRRERYVGRFERRFGIGVPVQADAIKATFKDGVLTVTLPKPAEVKPRSIEIAAE